MSKLVATVLAAAAIALTVAPACGRPAVQRSPFLPPPRATRQPAPHPPSPVETTETPAPPAPAVRDVTVMGILRNHRSVALIRNRGTVETVRAGDTVQGFRVTAVGARALHMRRGSILVTIPLGVEKAGAPPSW